MRTDKIFGLFVPLALFAGAVAAQPTATKEKQFTDATGGSPYLLIVIVIVSLSAAFFFWQRSRKGGVEQKKDENRYRNYSRNETFDLNQLDADEELEWLRKAKKKSPSIKYGQKKVVAKASSPKKSGDLNLDTKVFQEKMKMLQYAQLPINSFNELKPANSYTPLPFSNDKDLLTAIEQANEEFEEDAAVRELAVRILAAFRTQNSVEALSQIAFYDLSANLRSKSVSILTDFDHESVFETIVLACADPTREVRAAAARGLFRLNIDRADAWTRIIESGDEYRMSHAARAAIEAEIAQRSFDRLVHDDPKIAYEAFALVALMIKAAEDKEIFDAIREHKDERVKLALLHVIKVMHEQRSLDSLMVLKENEFFSTDVANRINDLIMSYERVAA